ncbi:sugar-binding protein [Flavobacterium cellulosilyticum]|uniref:Carbohydrate-binding domain-containing protein n=1 Tax=Flavobacterium cellulosilyticum TaxID=2541731 RepID=A0A4R5CLJ5_9FLAO|nr:sugar-binding protein [Flavobacterium cellulosilyticum]TDD99510.1 hypothetical protein E0F76_01940 [Flavobacterium cellulosilyticum]
MLQQKTELLMLDGTILLLKLLMQKPFLLEQHLMMKEMWDDTYVYLFAKVVDDVKKNDSANAYEDDSIEFYFEQQSR